MAKRSDVTRRNFLRSATVTVATIALGSCSDDETAGQGAAGTGGGGTGGGGTGGTGTGGGGTGGTGTGGNGTGGTGTGGGGTGGNAGGQGGAGGGGTGGGALVGLARGTTTEQAVRTAVGLTAGGLSFIGSGDTVILKPNVNSGDGPPYSTNPEVVAAVATMCFERGASRVIVAERSNCGRDTASSMAAAGITAAAQAAGAEVIALSDDVADWVEVSPPGATSWPGPWRIPALLSQADHIINLPIVKTHSGANYTMALKNLVGYLFCDDRGTLHGRLYNRAAELHLAIQPAFVVMDGTHALIEGGPTPGGSAVEADPPPGIIIATADPIANDATGLALVKHLGSTYPPITSYGIWDQPVLARGVELGFGISGPSEYDAAAVGVPELDDLLALITA